MHKGRDMMDNFDFEEYKQHSTIRNIVIVIVVAALIVLAGYVIYRNFFDSPLVSSVTVEAGTKNLSAQKFIKENKYKGKIKKGLTSQQLRTPGTYPITITVRGRNYDSEVKVQDTQKPSITGVNNMTVDINSKPDYEKGVAVSDNAAKKAKLSVNDKKVNMKKTGVYPITYIAKDASGNTTKEQAEVKVVNLKKIMNQKVVYLTFDDGPSPNTQKIVKILKKNHVKATFFVTAQEPQYFKWMKKAYQQGNFIAAHSYTHQFSIYRSEKTYFKDLDKIENVIKKYTGKKSNVVRFPGGSSNTVSRHFAIGIMKKLTKDLEKRGYQYVDWNLDSTDASGNNVPVGRIVANATSTYSHNLCILMHDAGAKRTTVKALPAIIKYYKKHHYKFATLANTPHVYHQRINN